MVVVVLDDDGGRDWVVPASPLLVVHAAMKNSAASASALRAGARRGIARPVRRPVLWAAGDVMTLHAGILKAGTPRPGARRGVASGVIWAAIAFALLAALLVAVGSVAQQREAVRSDKRGVGLFIDLARNPRWWAGWAGDTGGYIAQAAALGLGSLLIVGPLMVTSLLFALPLSARWNKRPIEASELWWALLLVGAIGVFLIAGRPETGVDTAPFSDWVPTLIILGVVVAGALVVVTTLTGRVRAVALAVGAGTLYGVTSAATKSAMNLLGDGIVPLLTGWETYLVIATGIGGFTMHQLSFQAGSLELSLPAISILDPIIGAALGITVLAETVRADGLKWVLIGASIVAMVIGTVALARAGVPRPTTETGADTTRSSPPRAG